MPDPDKHAICYAWPRRVALSAWIQHVPFGMFLVELHRPAAIVELGTRNGVSYSAFCQAVQRLGLSTRCMAVDTWEGDAHTGKYGPSVLDDLRQHHDPLYAGFSRLNQTTFDEAARTTPAGSVDLLHIDGFHTYEASSHDFETWLPKLSQRAVVLFHDIAEWGRDFGVWKLWDQLVRRYPTFAFSHGHGLGVVAVGSDIPEAVAPIFHLSHRDASNFRRFFLRCGRSLQLRKAAEYALHAPARLIRNTGVLMRGPTSDAGPTG